MFGNVYGCGISSAPFVMSYCSGRRSLQDKDEVLQEFFVEAQCSFTLVEEIMILACSPPRSD